MADLSNQKMTGKPKFTETVHYKGELRIIGQVVNSLNDKEPIGYVIMTEKNQQIKMYTVPQTQILLQKFKFVNAELQNGKIVNTECAMDKLMKFDTHMNVIGNKGIYILAEITTDGKNDGYRAMDYNGRIVDVSENDLLKLSSNVPIINAKVVNKENKQYVSAIKSEFTKIERSKLDQILTKNKNSAADEWRKQRRREKLIYHWAPGVLINATHSSKYNKVQYFPVGMLSYKNKGENHGNMADPLVHFDDIVKIMVKEILPEYLKDDQEKAVLKRILDKYTPLIDREASFYCSGKVGLMEGAQQRNNCLMAIALCQFLLHNPKVVEKVTKCATKIPEDSGYNILRKEGLTTPIFDALAISIQKKYKDDEAKRIEEASREASRGIFNTSEFKTQQQCAQIGFIINEKYKDMEFKTDRGTSYKLKYVGDLMPFVDYEKYVKMANCLGDVLCLAQIEKTNAVDYFDDEEVLQRTEIILAIMSIYRPDIVKEYIEERGDAIRADGMLPCVDFNSATDYKLSPEIKLWYESGFNVFLNDSGHKLPSGGVRRYTKHKVRNAKYINFRSKSAGMACVHTMLTEELAAIVGMITSDRVTPECIEIFIGKLRVW